MISKTLSPDLFHIIRFGLLWNGWNIHFHIIRKTYVFWPKISQSGIVNIRYEYLIYLLLHLFSVENFKKCIVHTYLITIKYTHWLYSIHTSNIKGISIDMEIILYTNITPADLWSATDGDGDIWNIQLYLFGNIIQARKGGVKIINPSNFSYSLPILCPDFKTCRFISLSQNLS